MLTSEKKRRSAADGKAEAMTEPTDEILRQWLLGRLPGNDAAALEERLVEDEDFSLRLRDVENDLLDDFARDRLAGEERARAAAYFSATPADRARLRIARSLASVAAAPDARERHPQRHAAASDARGARRSRRRVWATGIFASACAVAIAVVGLWRHADVTTSDAQALTITLMANHQRGAETANIGIPSATNNLRLQVEVDEANADTRYSLRIEDGDSVAFSADDLAPRVSGPYRFVEIVLPAAKLSAGRHRVSVAVMGATETGPGWILTTRTMQPPAKP